MKALSRKGRGSQFLVRAVSEQKHKGPQPRELARLVLHALMLASIFIGISLPWKSVVLAADPLMLTYRTVSAEDSLDLPGTTVFTLEIEVTNGNTMGYDNVSVTVGSLTNATSNYGSIAVGYLFAGSSTIVTGTVSIPNEAIQNMILRINHS